MSITLINLPINVQILICTNLEAKDICKLERVSKRMNSNLNSNVLWKSLLERAYPNYEPPMVTIVDGIYKKFYQWAKELERNPYANTFAADF